MACKLCVSNPIFKLPNGKLCKRCFIQYFENKVFKTIRKHKLFDFNDKFVCAVSGGKDSITVLYLSHKFLKRKNKQKNIIALAIDEGIKDYREHTLDFLTKFCKKHKIELHINSYKQSYGLSLDENISILKKKNTNVSSCNLCGTYRRTALNTGARELGATKVITGHNLDDEAQSILLNVFKNNYKILSRLGPNNGIVKDTKFVPRIKPLYMMSEKEIRLYTILMGFDVGYDECPYAKDSFRGNIGDMLNRLEDKHIGIKTSTVKFYLEIQKDLQDKFIRECGSEISFCAKCGEPSQRVICNTCSMQSFIKEK